MNWVEEQVMKKELVYVMLCVNIFSTVRLVLTASTKKYVFTVGIMAAIDQYWTEL